MRSRVLQAACLGGVLLASVAAAQPGRSWQSLSPEERQRAWENYQRYREMPDGRQRMIDRRYQQFRQMPPEQRKRLRQNYEAYRGQRPEQRREFTEKYRRWKKQGGR
jgi:hypothetical protein